MLSDIKKVHERVEYILQRHPSTRDSDKELWLAYNCMFNDLKKSVGNYLVFKAWVLRHHTPVFESLSRARRKVQETKPDLRGEQWMRRQEEAERVSEWSK